MKVTIKKIGRREVQTKYGMKPNLSIQDEKGQWYSGWPSKETANWREGQVVDIDVTERTVDGPQGPRTFYNFTPHIIGNDEIMKILKEIHVMVKTLGLGASKKGKNSKGGKAEESMPLMTAPDEEIPPPDDDEMPPNLNDDDIPF